MGLYYVKCAKPASGTMGAPFHRNIHQNWVIEHFRPTTIFKNFQKFMILRGFKSFSAEMNDFQKSKCPKMDVKQLYQLQMV